MTIYREQCPFKVGDLVIYRPSMKGLDFDAMSGSSGRLVPGEIYEIVEIRQDCYVRVDEYMHPGGGIYWTEFEPVDG